MIPTRAIFALLLAISTSLALAGEVVVDSGDIGTDIPKIRLKIPTRVPVRLLRPSNICSDRR